MKKKLALYAITALVSASCYSQQKVLFVFDAYDGKSFTHFEIPCAWTFDIPRADDRVHLIDFVPKALLKSKYEKDLVEEAWYVKSILWTKENGEIIAEVLLNPDK